MEPILLRELIEAVGGTPVGEFACRDLAIAHVDIDSRNIRPGALYLPLVGDRFDGHSFIPEALQAGAAGCLLARERDDYRPDKFYIKVSNTKKALRDLARYYKRKFNIPFIGITGSVGKTTTKEMVTAVLSARFAVHKTWGNFNNEIGLPLTLLDLDKSHEICVLEMGTNHFGEIAYLSELVEPDVALITNIGDCHIEFLGSRAGILKAKCEIFPPMPEGGLAILNGDDPLLAPLRGTLPMQTVLCGRGEDLDYTARALRRDADGRVTCRVVTPRVAFEAAIPAPGDHMIYPVLMAAAVAERYGMTPDEIIRGIAAFAPGEMRMNILTRPDGTRILDDAYNANPQSMQVAIDVLAQVPADYRVAVLGDMFELGGQAEPLHAALGGYLTAAGIDCLVAVGPLARHIYDAAGEAGIAERYWCEQRADALEQLPALLRSNAAFLVKASRGMAFEELTARLVELTEEAPT